MKSVKPTRSGRTVKGTFNAPGGTPGTARAAAPKRGGLTLTRLLAFTPIALEIASYLRGQQKARRGKYYKASTKGKALDFVLEQAQRRLGKAPKKKGWF